MRKGEFNHLYSKFAGVFYPLTAFIFIIAAGAQTVFATENAAVRKPEYKADQALKSNAKVNPSTLAVELAIPIGGFSGRGGTGLPIVFNYSSKVWQIYAPPMSSWQDDDASLITDTKPLYARRSAAGWSSNLGVPRIDYELGIYEGNEGMPFGPFLAYTGPSGGCPLCSPTAPNFALYYVKRVQVTMPDGSSHEFRKDDSLYSYGTANNVGTADLIGRFLSVDGSKMILELGANSSTLYMPDGSRYLFGQAPSSGGHLANAVIDRSGNQMTYNASNRQWTDTLGRTVTDPMPQNWFPFDQAQVVEDKVATFPGFGTGTLDVTFRWRYLKDPDPNEESGLENPSEDLHYTANKYCQGDLMYNVPGDYLFNNPEASVTRVCAPGYSSAGDPFNPIVLTSITLPNGQKYEFKYNVFGEISKVIYPTGAYERFEYDKVKTIQPQDVSYDQANRGVKYRWVSVKGDGTDEVQWSYSITHNYGEPFTVTTTNPDNTKTKQYLYTEQIGDPQPYGFGEAKSGRSYEDRVLSSTDQLLRRKLTGYTWTGAQSGGYADAERDLRPNKEITIIFEPGETYALAQMTETVYDTNSDPEYFAELNAELIKTYDYVVVSATTAASADITTAAGWFTNSTPATITEMDYLYDANYKARNISGLVTETRIKDGSGNVKAKTEISYDQSGYLMSSTGTMPTAAANSWIDLTDSSQLGSTIGSKRGLPTTVKSYYDITNNLYIQTHSFYDQYGNLRKSRDGRGNDTETQYDATYAFAYPTKVITPIPDSNGTTGSNAAFETTTDYDYNTGLPTLVTDPNEQETEMLYNDALLRLTKVIAPNGQETITEYGAGTSASTRFIKVKTQIDNVKWKEGYSWFDGLGRTIKTQSVDSNGDVFALTCYDQYGRVEKVSNPFRNVSNPTCSSSLEWTTTTYDAAGRVWKVTTPDNAFVETNYSLAATNGYELGTVVTVTDQASKQRRSLTNALGQLKRVDEPDVNNSNQLGTIIAPYQPTFYEYDTLSNLTKVKQGGTFEDPQQTRTFVYDSLSRLKSATNPESGLIQYAYDNNGNLTTKTDARNVVTTYGYDALNRVSTRSYTAPQNLPNYEATPTVTYTYDNVTNAKGKLTKVSSSVSETRYTSFDILGRVTASEQRIPFSDTETISTATPRVSTYTYNLSGALIEQTYPSGRVVKNVLDNDGSLSMVQSKKNANYGFWNYAQNFTYTAAGAVSSMQLGNFKWESTTFNSRLQPTQIALGTTPGATNVLKLDYTYNTPSTADNNGNVLSQTITVPTVGSDPGFTAVQNYSYDSLNRLKDAIENLTPSGGSSVQTWKQTFTFDRYGNRNFDEANTTTLPKDCNNNTEVCAADRKVFNPSINTSNNRLSTSDGYTFDDSGNTTRDAQSRKFTYDGENKQIKVETVDSNGTVTGLLGEYRYDGDGKRVKKYSFENNEWLTTIFIYDASGKLVEEYSTKVETTDPKVSYLTNDHLGSPRITTDRDGQTISRRDFQPFGEEIAASQRTQGLGYTDDTVRQKFTSYERDNEIDLDFAQARYFDSGFGRFSTPDYFVNDTRVKDPQSWNLYVYVRNNPLNSVDPLGKKAEVIATYDEKTNTTKIKIRASFVIYGAAGQNVTKNDLKKFKELLENGIKSSWNGQKGACQIFCVNSIFGILPCPPKFPIIKNLA